MLSEKTYIALKRMSPGGRYQLRPSDLSLCDVTSDRLNILGVVRLPVSLGRNTSVMRLDFYVTSNFSLPSAGLLGLSSLRFNRMVVIPDTITSRFRGRYFKAMDPPVCLASPWEIKDTPSKGRESVFPESVVHTVPILSTVPVPDTGTTSLNGKPPTPSDVSRGWKYVNAIVVGNHEIYQRPAMYIPVTVPNATVGCNICPEEPSRVNTLREGSRTGALVVNTTGGPVKLKNGVFLGRALAFDGQVLPEPLELRLTCVGAVGQPGAGDKTYQASAVATLVKVVDYPELKGPLLKLLHQYRDVIALLGEPLGATGMTEHKIKVKPDTKPVYIPAYRLPHSQRQIVDEQVIDMLHQGVIQHSRSPCNSPLFLVPKKDGSFRPVIDFRKVNEVTEDDRSPCPF